MAVLTLRPNSNHLIDGSYRTLGGQPGSYTEVDEVSKNEGDGNRNINSFAYQRGIFGFPNHTTQTGPITNLTIKGYYKRVDTLRTGGRCNLVVKIASIIYNSVVKDPGTTTTLQSWSMNVKPSNSQAWTWADIDALLAGDTLNADILGKNNSFVESYQYWVEVTYPTPTAPSVTTSAASLIEETTARLNGNVTSDGGSAITARGFKCDKNPTPTTNFAVAGTTGAYIKDMTSLDPGSTYYFRAFATNAVGTTYGSTLSFLTKGIITSYATEQTKISRTPCDLVILTIDTCAETFGVGGCTASSAEKCFNTFPTCRDKANFNRTTKELKFTSATAPTPFKEGERPYIKKVTTFATEIKTNNITINAREKIEMHDEEDTDIGIDPYIDDRASVQGTYWKKFLARNHNYKGRLFKRYEGFIGLAEGDFELRFVGLLDNISRKGDSVTIEAVDMLSSMSDISVPAEIDCKLTTAITDSDVTLTVNDVSELAASGYIRISDEIIAYAGINGLQLTGCTRAQFGTIADEHDVDDKVQPCRYYSADNPFDVLEEMLDTDAAYDSSYIDSAAFADAKAWPGGDPDVWAIISEPTPLSDLYFELLELIDCKCWVAEDLKITIARNYPNRGGRTYTEWNDAKNIVSGSAAVDLNEESRITRVLLYWDKDALGDLDKQASYGRLNLAIDSDAESANEYDDTIKKEIWSRWLHSDCGTEEALAYWVGEFTGRYLMNRRDAAPIVTLAVELKDAGVKTGGYCMLTTDELCEADGGDITNDRFRVIRREQKADGKYQYKLERMPRHRVALINEEGAPDWDNATDAEKEYGYIGDNYGDLDGKPGYFF
ncbi:hypothetical protein ES708_01504 [subsurface metagenome]